MSTRLDRLAQLVRKRRTELGLTQAQLAAEAGTTDRLVRSIEKPEDRTRHPNTLRSLSVALGWSPDSIERVLAGKSPVLAGAEAAVIPDELEPLLRDVERRVAALRAELDEERRRRWELEAIVVDLAERLATRRQPDGPAERARQVRDESRAMVSRPSERQHEEETEDPPQAM